FFLCDPATGMVGKIEGLRAFLAGDPDAVKRLGHDAGFLAGEPVPPPAQRLLQVADQRPRRTATGIGMRPWADDAELWTLQVFEQARNEIGVAVLPAADGHYRAF